MKADSCFEPPFLCKGEIVKSEKCHFSVSPDPDMYPVAQEFSAQEFSAQLWIIILSLQDREVFSHPVGQFDFINVKCSIVNSKYNLKNVL